MSDTKFNPAWERDRRQMFALLDDAFPGMRITPNEEEEYNDEQYSTGCSPLGPLYGDQQD